MSASWGTPRLKTLSELIREGGFKGPKFSTKKWSEGLTPEQIHEVTEQVNRSFADELEERILRNMGAGPFTGLFSSTSGSTEKEYFNQFQGMPYTSAPPPREPRAYRGGFRSSRTGMNCCEDCGVPTLRDLCHECEGKRASSARQISAVSVSAVTPPPPDP